MIHTREPQLNCPRQKRNNTKNGSAQVIQKRYKPLGERLRNGSGGTRRCEENAFIALLKYRQCTHQRPQCAWGWPTQYRTDAADEATETHSLWFEGEEKWARPRKLALDVSSPSHGVAIATETVVHGTRSMTTNGTYFERLHAEVGGVRVGLVILKIELRKT